MTPEINQEIIYLFLKNLEKMTDRERSAIVKAIELIVMPIFVVNDKPNLTHL